VLLTSLVGCGTNSAACGSRFQSDSDRAPILINFELKRQLDGDPWTLIFSATFEDSDGDLGGLGQAKFFLSGEEAASLSLDDVFRQSGLTLNATDGVLALPLRFSETVVDGAQVVLGLQLYDGNSFASNCYSLGLEFGVDETN
jgi:hypothetical protein